MEEPTWRPGRRPETFKATVMGRQEVVFGGHALIQMDLRGITKEQVITALRNPTETGLPTTMFRFRIRRQLGRKKALDVVYEEHPKHILIITTFYKDFK